MPVRDIRDPVPRNTVPADGHLRRDRECSEDPHVRLCQARWWCDDRHPRGLLLLRRHWLHHHEGALPSCPAVPTVQMPARVSERVLSFVWHRRCADDTADVPRDGCDGWPYWQPATRSRLQNPLWAHRRVVPAAGLCYLGMLVCAADTVHRDLRPVGHLECPVYLQKQWPSRPERPVRRAMPELFVPLPYIATVQDLPLRNF